MHFITANYKLASILCTFICVLVNLITLSEDTFTSIDFKRQIYAGNSKYFGEGIPKIRENDPKFRDDLSCDLLLLKQPLLELSAPVMYKVQILEVNQKIVDQITA